MSFTPYVFGTGVAGWNFLQRTREQQQEVYEKSPVIDRAVQEFTQKITTVQTADQLLDDFSLLTVTLGAFGLDEDISNRAFIKQVLESDLSDDTSFVNRLNDNRYLALATTFGFGGDEGPKLPSEGAANPYAGVASPNDLLSNSTLLNKALKDSGLEAYGGNTFFLQRVLESDLDDPNSFVNKLNKHRSGRFRQAVRFQQTGGI